MTGHSLPQWAQDSIESQHRAQAAYRRNQDNKGVVRWSPYVTIEEREALKKILTAMRKVKL